jgi:hypothetical protein
VLWLQAWTTTLSHISNTTFFILISQVTETNNFKICPVPNEAVLSLVLILFLTDTNSASAWGETFCKIVFLLPLLQFPLEISD